MKKVCFPGQKKGEEVYFVLKKHWIVHVVAIIRLLILSIAPFLIYYLVVNRFLFEVFFYNSFLAMGFVYLALSVQYSFVKWFNDVLDFILITNQRLVDITQITLFHRNTSEARLEHIQDASGEIKGFFGTIFDYGNLHIRTANDASVFDLDYVPAPTDQASRIIDFIREGKIDEIKAINDIKSRVSRAFYGIFGK